MSGPCFGLPQPSPLAAQDQDRDRRYGAATVDHQGDAWIWVGECLTLVPPQPEGTPRRDSCEPLERGSP